MDLEDLTIRLRPRGPWAAADLGLTMLELGRPAAAAEELWVARSMTPEDDDILDALCRALYADNQKDDLYNVLRQRIVERGDMKDYFRLADYAKRDGDLDTLRQTLIIAARDRLRVEQPELTPRSFHDRLLASGSIALPLALRRGFGAELVARVQDMVFQPSVGS